MNFHWVGDAFYWLITRSADWYTALAAYLSLSVAVYSAVVAIKALRSTAIGIQGTAKGLEQQVKAQDLSTLRQFILDVCEREDRLLKAVPMPDDIYQHALADYMNLLEVYAAAVNHNLIETTTSNIVRDRMINDIALVYRHKEISKSIREAKTSKATFVELDRFQKENASAIKRIQSELDIQEANRFAEA